MSKLEEFDLKRLNGQPVEKGALDGKAVMLVNIASKCGFTPQLKNLENLYQEYRDKGLEILAFPSDDFNQEPLEGNEVEEFCQVNYGVSFKVMEKTHVKGSQAHPIFKYAKERGPFLTPMPKWNFHKYLFDKNGQVVDFYLPVTKPDSAKVRKKVEEILK